MSSTISLKLNLKGMTKFDLFALRDLISGVGPAGCLMEAAPGFGTALGYKLDQAIQDFGEENLDVVHLDFVVNDKTPDNVCRFSG